MRFILMANPNVGQSSLFYALTQVACLEEAKTASFAHRADWQLLALPGLYSLSTAWQETVEMQLAAETLLNHPFDVIINVLDARYLERDLVLCTQLMELGKPMLLVLTEVDTLKNQNIFIDVEALQDALGLPVWVYSDSDSRFLERFLERQPCIPSNILTGPSSKSAQPSRELFATRRLAECKQADSLVYDVYAAVLDKPVMMDFSEAWDERYTYIHRLLAKVYIKQQSTAQKVSQFIDKWVLHPVYSWPIFILVLWSFFTLAVDVGGQLQVYISNLVDGFFKTNVSQFFLQQHVPLIWRYLLVDGLGQGISTMLSFLPVMACMTLFLSLLESSGYMARVASLFERMMRRLGLPGKAFLPLLIGFGCNVPAIMAARLVDGKKERLLTVLLSPFMSCSARLTIYAVFASLFFPNSGGLVVLSLYALGMLMAILTGLVLRRFWLTGQALPVQIDLPSYRIPDWSKILREVYLRLKLFLWRSGQLVLPFCMVLGSFQAAVSHGWMLSFGIKQFFWQIWIHFFHPILAPMGIQVANWPAAVGLLTGTMAKEVVIATLNTLYSQMPVLKSSLILPHENNVFFNQLFVLPDHSHLSLHSKRSLMYAFGSPSAAYSYLLFVLLYIPCISTLAIIRQEVGRFWQWFALIWSLILSYSVATSAYQLINFAIHPMQTTLWCSLMVLIWLAILLLLRYWKPIHVK